jgi:ABC-type polysaccharide/polyol phosphate transport system ATPase subunit
MTTPAIEFSGVGKRYWKLEQRAMLLKSLMPFARQARTELWALRDVDLRIDPGETVGIVGRNGAGKTTLLRLMAGVTSPSAGKVRISGRVAPLISVGVGFHQEMSGRENVYVNGMLLGLTAKEVDERFDRIVEFAEIADFIDTPVKFYSSGMFMRLGFSVAINVDPTILLVDEILAVGDLAFQFKCFERMRELQANGTSVVIVSHSMHAIRLLCPRAILFRKGSIEFDGPSEAAIARHFALLGAREDGGEDDADITVLSRALQGVEGADHHANYDQLVEMHVRLRFNREMESPHFRFQIQSESGLLLSTTQSTVGAKWRRFAAGEETEVKISFRSRFGGGSYRLVTIVTESDGATPVLRDEGLVLYIAPRVGAFGFADPLATIDVDGDDRTAHESMSLGGTSPAAAPSP